MLTQKTYKLKKKNCVILLNDTKIKNVYLFY